MPSILTFTLNPTVDLTWEVDRLEAAGKVRARVRSVVSGGGGINVARGVTRLGGTATALHSAGGDTGRRLNRLLDLEDFEHRAVDIRGETREALVILETEAARSFHIVPAGPSMTEEEATRGVEALMRAAHGHRYVVVSGSLPPGAPRSLYADVAGRVRSVGSRLVLDTSGEGLQAALEEGVFLVKPNRREASRFLGHPVEGFDDARLVNERLLETRAAVIVVTTIGARGALCSTSDGHTEIRTPPLPRPAVSDAGAGDSLVAGLTFGLVEADDAVDACVLGVAAAAASVLTPGTELFDPAEVESLRARVEVRNQDVS